MVLSETNQTLTTPDHSRMQLMGRNSIDPYVQSLLALSYVNTNKLTLASQLTDKLKTLMTLTIPLQRSSLVNSGGEPQLVEYNAFATLALLSINASAYSPQIQQNVEYLLAQVKEGGVVGNSFATAMCLMTFNKYRKLSSTFSGSINLKLNNLTVKTSAFD